MNVFAFLLLSASLHLPALPSTPTPTPLPTPRSVATPTTAPSVRPSPITAPAIATAAPPLGSPRQFSQPAPVPVSPQQVEVLISGPPRFPTPQPTDFPDPTSWPIGLPSLREPDGSSAIDVVVFGRDGAVVARGNPEEIPSGGYQWSESESFALDRVLVPATDAYVISARYRADPSFVGSSRYLIADVPTVKPHIGAPYILTFPNGAPVSTILYARRIETDGDRTFVTLKTRGRHPIEETIVLPENRWMVGAMVVSSDLADVRRHFLGADAVSDASLTCYNAQGRVARITLLPGKHVHLDLIVRAVQTTTWVPDDPRSPLDCYGACDARTGTFVESPVIVGFRVEQSDVRIVPQKRGNPMSTFSGRCVRGYIVLRDPGQMRDVFTVVP